MPAGDRVTVVCLGPATGFPTGQSCAFKEAVSAFSPCSVVIDLGGEGVPAFRKILKALWAVPLFLWLSRLGLRKRVVLYATPSRSFLGFFRELPVFALAMMLRVPYVNHIHGADLRGFYRRSNKAVRFGLQKLYCHSACNIVLANGMKDQLEDFTDAVVEVVPNFVDHSNVVEKKLPGSLFRVTYLSNLIEAKGVFHLLRAYSRLDTATKAAVDLVVAGGGVDSPGESGKEIEERVRTISTSVGARYLGPVYGDEKWELLATSDVFALPTFYPTEAFPLVLLEAMASGCFILTTKHNYLADIVRGAEALLIEPKNEGAIALALEKLLANKSTIRSSRSVNQDRSKAFSVDSFRERLRDIVFRAAN